MRKENNKNVVLENVTENNTNTIGMSSILAKIIAYPVESKSPMEVVNFVTELRNDISKLF